MHITTKIRAYLRAGLILTLVAVTIVVVNFGFSHPTTAQTTPREIRGVWITNVDSNVLFKPDRLKQAIDDLATHNFNTIYPVVWNWGYTTYPSRIAQAKTGSLVDPRPDSLQNRDTLAELIQIAHNHKMAVMPWFEFGFMAPADSALALRHPDWLTHKQNGDQVWQEGIYPRVWLNPLHPAVQQFIQDLVVEVVTNYDIDGIQLDDHFGLPYAFGYDSYTIALYQKEHQGRQPPTNPKDPEWVRWRANKITDFTKQLFRAIKAKKSHVIFGLSPNNYSFSLNHSLQDWRRWEREGYIEELVLQVYRNSDRSFQTELRRPEVQAAKQHIPVAIGILSGLRKQPVSSQQIQRQVDRVRSENFTGVSFFFYETLWNLTAEPRSQRQASIKQLFPSPVERVSLPL